MKQYQSKYGYTVYWCEGDDWKHPKRWKKSRPFCLAKCRDGHACQARAVVDPKTDKPLNGRCKNHGGRSTGAKTESGKERSREGARQGMLRYWQKRKANSSGTSPIFPTDSA